MEGEEFPLPASRTTMNPNQATALLARAEAAEAAGETLSRDDIAQLVDAVLDGGLEPDAFAAWLTRSADRLPVAAEVAGVADALRRRMRPLEAAVARPVVDTCGTGGDGSGSFNISTAAALVVAAAGVPVAKHGNRAVSSKTGSADVLEQFGVRVDAPLEVTRACLEQAGICFCFAPAHHPAMAVLGPLRRRIGRPTVFNLVGPLCNPAAATVQVIGVGRPGAERPLAEAARLIGLSRALIVSAEDGVDEVGLFAATRVIEVTPDGLTERRWTPEDFGLATAPPAARQDLVVSSAAASAERIGVVLAGAPGPCRDIVVLNAAAVLWAAGRAEDLPAARELAEQAIDSGAAAATLKRLAEMSQS